MGKQKVFTLKDEAYQTTHRSRFVWGSDARLRNNPVPFATAGFKDPLTGEDDLGSVGRDVESAGSERGRPDDTAFRPEQPLPGEETYCEGFESIESAERPLHRSVSSSDTGDEVVILFKGRGKARTNEVDPFSLEAITHEVEGLEGRAIEERKNADDVNMSDDNLEGTDVESDADNSETDYLANLLAANEQLTVSRFHFRDLGDSDDIFLGGEYEAALSEPEVSFSLGDGRRQSSESHDSTHRRKEIPILRSKKKAKATGLVSRYPVGMTMEQIIQELRTFLSSSEEQISFPPLSKPFRKAIHEMARPLRLKSKSIGKGETRRPILYRTKATPTSYSEALAVAIRIACRFLDGKQRAIVNAMAKNHRAIGRYKDGDVVGNGLPELGTENRGRAMLEKMGWSTGMGLGAHDNQGIIQPVPQIVKHSKAGLG